MSKTTCPIKPVNDWIVCDSPELKEKSTGGIILPSASDECKTYRAKVLAIGPGKLDHKGDGIQRFEMPFKIGDTVVFAAFTDRNKLKHDGKNYMLFREHDILAILDE